MSVRCFIDDIRVTSASFFERSTIVISYCVDKRIAESLKVKHTFNSRLQKPSPNNEEVHRGKNTLIMYIRDGHCTSLESEPVKLGQSQTTGQVEGFCIQLELYVQVKCDKLHPVLGQNVNKQD